MKNFPFFPFFLAIFPVLALLGNNIQEVDPRVALRPLAISLAATLILFLFARLILRSWVKASLITCLLIVLFFSYGHLYHLLRNIPNIGISLARHRYLFPATIMTGLLGLIGIAWKVKDGTRIIPAFNLASILLLVYPGFQVASSLLRTSMAAEQTVIALSAEESLDITESVSMPDIYYIILDMHTRSDALQEDYYFDNSDFINDLKALGFYVADCSRSNYTSTNGSLISTLNMEYMDVIQQDLGAQTTNAEEVMARLKYSLVRYQLEALGYKTFAFESEYEWSRLTDAYAYLGYTRQPYALQVLQPFEVVLIESTALLLWSDAVYQSMPDYVNTPFHGINFALEDHVNRQLFILDQLPQLASLSEHKFVFAHIIVPHVPFVFESDGSIVTDPGYYSGDFYEPVDREHLVQGYLNQVAFIDSRIIDVLRQIVENSSTPPIIILQGDHGLENENRLVILNAYYLPDDGSTGLYPSITPVNSFRYIFNTYFNGHYELLPDLSYSEAGEPVPESYPGCLTTP